MIVRRNDTRSRNPIKRKLLPFVDEQALKKKQKSRSILQCIKPEKRLKAEIPEQKKIGVPHLIPKTKSCHSVSDVNLWKALGRQKHQHSESTEPVSESQHCENSFGGRQNRRKLDDGDLSKEERNSNFMKSSSDLKKPKHSARCKSYRISSEVAVRKDLDNVRLPPSYNVNLYHCSVNLGERVSVPCSTSQKGKTNKMSHCSSYSSDDSEGFDNCLKSILSKTSSTLKAAKKVLHWADGAKHTKDVSVQAVPVSNAYVQTDPVEIISVSKLSSRKKFTWHSQSKTKNNALRTRGRWTRSS